MDKPELLAEFKTQLESFEKFKGFIEKAQEKKDKFRPEVVEKVVRDNTAKMADVAAVLDPLVGQMQGVIDDLTAQKTKVSDEIEAAQLALEELELRKEIGELDEDGFESEASGYREQVSNGESAASALDEELTSFSDTLEAWIALRPEGGAPLPEPAPAPVEDDLLDDAFAGDDEGFEDMGRGEGVHVQKPEGVVDDVSAVFDDDPPAPAPAIDLGQAESDEDEDEDEALAVGEADDEGISFGDDDLGELGDDVEAPSVAGADAEASAVLILGEGTDEEQLYPFTGEVISLGRGRDNTIQVKNDSKVSRYHCKLFKRDGSFFVEDNKSANGTLVDGELITEKRLMGGEEIVIGETFFRFRVGA